jgi:hypothetical protein
VPDPHPILRAAERYGVTLTLADLDRIVLDIKSAKLRRPSTALLQRVERDGVELWFVEAGGMRLRVVYGPEMQRVLTVIPLRDTSGKLDRPCPRHVQGRVGRRRRERAVVEEWA